MNKTGRLKFAPMKGKLSTGPFQQSGWIYEIKYDGYRGMVEKTNNRVNLMSLNGNSFNNDYPTIVSAFSKIPHSFVIDGEVVALDKNGRPDFEMLQGKSGKIVFYAFDILEVNGNDVRHQPLLVRKAILEDWLLRDGKNLYPGIFYSTHTEEGLKMFDFAESENLEGLMAKKSSSPYESGKRSSSWVKIKTRRRQEFVIGGYESGGKRGSVKALLVGVYKKGKLTYTGKVGSGFKEQTLKEFSEQFRFITQKESSFVNPPKNETNLVWLKPKLVCEVEFQELTRRGLMRHASFKGLRFDKSPTDVSLEVPELGYQLAKKGASGRIESDNESFPPMRELKLTNLDKVFWPEQGYTKGDLINYYLEVAPTMLPYLKDRPESLNRQPNGYIGKNFYQKNMTGKLPKFIDTFTVPSSSAGEEDICYMMINNVESLLYAANLGAIEINPWLARYGKPNHPDFLLIDLDPLDLDFQSVVTVALGVKKLLDELKVPSFPKTSGKKGLHICIPLEAKYPFEIAQVFAHMLVSMVHFRFPELTSIDRSRSKRHGMVYLDYLQNRRSQTMAAPYSVRPWPGATVSCPLNWFEVNERLNPAKFTIETMPQRIKEVGDLWAPVLQGGIKIDKLLKQLSPAKKAKKAK